MYILIYYGRTKKGGVNVYKAGSNLQEITAAAAAAARKSRVSID